MLKEPVTPGRYRMRNGEAVSVYVDRTGWVRCGTGVWGRVCYPSGLFSAQGPTEYDLIARLPDYPIRIKLRIINVEAAELQYTLFNPPDEKTLRNIIKGFAEYYNCKVSELEVIG